jgi:hypothetical protein
VLALLALACFPVLAQADSGTIEYDPSLPSDGGAKQNENIAKSSESPSTRGAETPTSGGTGEGYPAQAPPSSEGQGSTNAGTGGGSGQGSPDKGNNPPAGTKVQSAAPNVQPASSTGGGSSPLVPILIAIAALAAISIAALLIRQRRQRDGSGPSLSTKAG